MSRVPKPQHDKPLAVTGGMDVWDNDTAGKLLSDDYFHSPVLDTLYIGPNWAARYLGTKAESALYLGTKALHA